MNRCKSSLFHVIIFHSISLRFLYLFFSFLFFLSIVYVVIQVKRNLFSERFLNVTKSVKKMVITHTPFHKRSSSERHVSKASLSQFVFLSWNGIVSNYCITIINGTRLNDIVHWRSKLLIDEREFVISIQIFQFHFCAWTEGTAISFDFSILFSYTY